MVLDGNSIVNRAYYGVGKARLLTTRQGLHTNAIYGFLNILERLRAEEETLRRENETLRGPAAQYQSLKDHIADIEISAHHRTEEFRSKAIAELMELVDGQRRLCAQQEAAYRQMNEGILAELRKAQCCVEECDLGNFQQFQESLRQLAETINGGE